MACHLKDVTAIDTTLAGTKKTDKERVMESHSEIRNSIIDFVNSNFLMGTNSVPFGDEDSFQEKGIVDSTGVLEMVGFIQKSFNIAIEDWELTPENLDSVSSIVTFISRKRAGTASLNQ